MALFGGTFPRPMTWSGAISVVLSHPIGNSPPYFSPNPRPSSPLLSASPTTAVCVGCGNHFPFSRCLGGQAPNPRREGGGCFCGPTAWGRAVLPASDPDAVQGSDQGGALGAPLLLARRPPRFLPLDDHEGGGTLLRVQSLRITTVEAQPFFRGKLPFACFRSSSPVPARCAAGVAAAPWRMVFSTWRDGFSLKPGAGLPPVGLLAPRRMGGGEGGGVCLPQSRDAPDRYSYT